MSGFSKDSRQVHGMRGAGIVVASILQLYMYSLMVYWFFMLTGIFVVYVISVLRVDTHVSSLMHKKDAFFRWNIGMHLYGVFIPSLPRSLAIQRCTFGG